MRVSPATKFEPQVRAAPARRADIWLTTVRSDGTPEPNPVLFFWDGSTFLIYGKRGSRKLDHIARNHASRSTLTATTRAATSPSSPARPDRVDDGAIGIPII